MADFCLQCSEEHGFPENDVSGLCKEDEMIPVLCEGCGNTFVDHEGRCLSKNCLCHHGGHITLTGKCQVCAVEYELNQGPRGDSDRGVCRVHWNARINRRRRPADDAQQVVSDIWDDEN